MQKILSLLMMVFVSLTLYGQTSVNISGQVTYPDGSPAEGVLLYFVDDTAVDTSNFVETITNPNGFYTVSLEVADPASGGCVSVLMFDCDGSIFTELICYDANNLDLNLDILYCANGSNGCFGFIIPDVSATDSTMTLLAVGLGVAPFTYQWSNGSTSESISVTVNDSLYCVTITDNTGCVFETCFSYAPPPPCEVYLNIWPTGTGVVLFAESWGNEPITYQWNTGEVTPEIDITENGTYCVTTTDASGCIAEACQTVNLDSMYNGLCLVFIEEINSDSAVVLTANGLFSSDIVSFEWSTGDTTQSIEVTEYGVYCVTITTADGCIADACFDYFEQEACGVWLSCDPTTSGIQLFAWGWGAPPVEYVWSTGETGEFINVLANGEYCVTATDAEGCVAIACQVVNVDSIFGGNCLVFIEAGINSDSANVLTAQGWFGSDVVEYVWSTGETGQTITVTEDGTYCVTATFADGCLAEACYQYYIPADCGVWFLCDPTAAGGVQLIAFGWGAEPIEYVWSNGDVGNELIVLEDGEYCVTATDANGCVAEACQFISINPPNDCWVNLEVTYNDTVDFATITAIPEIMGNYEFFWNDIDQTGPSITVTEPGVYCVEALNLDTGCLSWNCIDVFFGQQDCFGWIESTETATGNTLSVFIIGEGPFTYEWSTGETTAEIFVVTQGEFCVDVTGADGCTFSTCFYHLPGSNDTTGTSMIWGYVFDSLDVNTWIEANVTLYRLNADGELVYHNEMITEAGSYFFTGLPYSQYVVKAEAISTGTDNPYAPTYHFSTTFWEDADLVATGDFIDASAPIAMIRTSNVNGGGNISGTVTDGDGLHGGTSGEVRDGDPVADINILLKFEGTLVGYDKTDEEGRFQFASLPMGVYEVIMERTGKERKSVFVTLSPAASSLSNVEFSTGLSTATSDPEYLNDLVLSPNPARSYVRITFEQALTNEVNIAIYDLTGRTIDKMSKRVGSGQQEIELDIQNLNSGVYLLSISDGKRIRTERFIKE